MAWQWSKLAHVRSPSVCDTYFVLAVVHFSMMPAFMQNNNSIKFLPSCSVVRTACVFRYLLLNDTINISYSWLTTLPCASAGLDWISRTRRIRLLVGPLSLCLHYPDSVSGHRWTLFTSQAIQWWRSVPGRRRPPVPRAITTSQWLPRARLVLPELTCMLAHR